MIANLLNNLPMKIISILISLLLWFTVTSGESKISNFPGNIPLEYKNVPENTVAISDINKVNIKISAEKSKWKNLSASSFTAYLDLNGLDEGTYELPVIVKSNVPEIQILEKNPANILVRIEPTVSKEVSIFVKTTGDPKKGYAVLSTTTEPEKIQIKGAQSAIDSIDEVTTTIDVTDRNEQFSTSTTLQALNAQGNIIKNIDFEPDKVSVITSFTKESGLKTVGININTTNSLPAGYILKSMSPTPYVIQLKGTADALKNVSSITTTSIDLSKINSSSSLELTYKLPDNISVIDAPDKIQVKIEIEQQFIKKDIDVIPVIVNLKSGLLIANIEPKKITLVISGPVNDINKFNITDIKINIDASNLKVGDNSVEIIDSMITLNSNSISINSISTKSIDIQVK